MSELSFYGQQCDDYVRQEFFPAKSILVDGSDGIASVAFDGEDEFLWTGGHSGLISSLYGLNSEPYSSFQAHDASEVRFLLPLDQRIVSITSDTVACSSKLGQPLYYHKSRSTSDLQCALLSPTNRLYLGGLRSSIVEFDLDRGTEVRTAEIGNAGNVILRFSSTYLCSGSTSGVVSLLDPNSLKLERSFDAHSGSLSDFDVCGNQLITCGFSLKNNGQQVIDRHLMMFDLRYCKAMAPMQMLIDPMYLRFIQTYSNQICVVSQNGKFQVLEQGCSGYQSPVYEVPMFGSHLTSCAVSSSNMVLAFGETSGYVHTFTGNHESPVFNHYLPDTEFASAEQNQLAGFGSSLSTTSYYPESSAWVSPVNQTKYRNPADNGSPLYHSMMHQGQANAFYAGNHMKSAESDEPFKLPQSRSKIKPNSLSLAGCESDQVSGGEDQLFVIPKCYRKVEIKYSKYGVDGFDFRSYNKTNFAGLETHIPNAYCNAMIQVLYFLEPLRNTLMNHLCEREFCLSCELGFLFHMLQQQTTRTCQATNFLRAFRTIPQVTALGLLLSDSDEALGKVDLARLIQNWNRFILQQLDSEFTRQASNKLHQNVEQELQSFSDVSFISNSPDSHNSRVTSDALKNQDVGDEKLDMNPNDIDNGLCIAVDSISLQPPEDRNLSIVKQLFAYNVSTILSCKVCGQSLERNTSLLIVDLLYPESTEPDAKVAKVPFSKVVERSLNDERRTRSWCSTCSKYQIHLQRKGLNSLPDVVSLHCHLESPSDFSFWRAQDQNVPMVNGDIGPLHPSNTKLCRYGLSCTRPDCRFRHDKPRNSSSHSENAVVTSTKGAWVPFRLRLFLKPDGKVRAIEDEDNSEPDAVCYELMASVAYIKGGKSGGGNHLVSHIMVDKGSGKGPSAGGQWYLFNDFAISPIDKSLAVSFDMDWKHPCLLYFAKVDINKKYNIPVAFPITPDVLFASNSLITPRISDMKFIPLNKFELPQEGDIIGLDAEFVKLKPEKAELHSDGTKSMIKPSQMSVARVTCIREKEPLCGVPFIDDYIATQEEVVDYLTEFSGIQPGDLDPALSCRYLTTLKSTYLKLRYLINANVIFVGHGLKKDFRVLNLVVPPEQIVDTVELFHLPKRRMISLKFLAWYFLGLKIQSSNHDSIEDSSAAIQLYYKYMELQLHGMDHVHEELERLYENGQQRNWRIPDDDEDLLYVGGLDLCLA